LRDLSAAQEPCEPLTHDFGKKTAFEEAALLAEDYEAEQEKRIAELERQNAELTSCVTDLTDSTNLLITTSGLLRERITDLQSQLAWTPVSAGLPTKHGFYELRGPVGSPQLLHVWGYHPRGWNASNGDFYSSPLEACAYTHFRRIELPEAPPPFAKETSPDAVREVHVAQGCVVPPTTTLTDQAQDADLPSVTVSITPPNTLNVDLNALEWCSLEESGVFLRELVRNLDHLIRQPVCLDDYIALVPTRVTTAMQLHVKAVSVMNSEMSKGRLFKEGGKWRFFQ
jgi:hypothetical protein